MSAYAFRFDTSRLHAAFAPRKPRHPLLRVAFGLIGLALLAVFVVFGVFVGTAMLAAGLLYRLWHQRRRPRNVDQHGRHVVEGEYRVVDKSVIDKSVLPSR